VTTSKFPEIASDAGRNTCPSAACEEGAVLLGIVGRDGVVAYLKPAMPIDADFVREARRGRLPEMRFRFAQGCVENRCVQWTGCRCGLIDKALVSSDGARVANISQGSLPNCAVRATCRWYAQAAARACAVCPFIIHSFDHRAAAQSDLPGSATTQ
jgi:hypothetical protein